MNLAPASAQKVFMRHETLTVTAYSQRMSSAWVFLVAMTGIKVAIMEDEEVAAYCDDYGEEGFWDV
jgi:hypothetical protein